MKLIDELKDRWKQTHERLERDVFKTWQIKYGEHVIRIDNFLDEEKLFVDGQLLDHNKRKHALERFIPYHTLKSQFVDNRGRTVNVHVTLGGFITLNCKVWVNNQLIFKDKYRISIF